MEKRCPKSPEWISSGPTSEAVHGFEFSELNVENMAVEVVEQDTSSEVISLLLEDWEVGRVALSCHLSVDLCQEMRDVCQRSSESQDFPRSLCSECHGSSLVEVSQQQRLFLTVDELGQRRRRMW